MNMEHHRGLQVKTKQELELTKALAKAALDLTDKGEQIFLPVDASGNFNMDRPATKSDVLQAIAAGSFQLFYHWVGNFGVNDTEKSKQQWLDEHPNHGADVRGRVYCIYGRDWQQPDEVPSDWLQKRAVVVKALINGGYLKDATNIIPLRAEPVKPRTPSPTKKAIAKGGIVEPEAERPDPNANDEPVTLSVALVYAQIGWFVFPIWGVRPDGRCGCGNPECKNIGKHPIGKLVPNGFKDATTDEATIRGWWSRYPAANIGIACGPSKLLVIDIDTKGGKDGPAAWERLKAEHGELGVTLEQLTGSGGKHLLFDRSGYEGTIKSSSSEDGLDVRADGGYIVAAPSRHRSGDRYSWLNIERTRAAASAPEWLCEWAANRKSQQKNQPKKDRPMKNRSRMEQGQHDKAVPYTPEEEARAISALKLFPAKFVDDRQNWRDIGMALHSTGWPSARSLFDEWSMGSAACGGANGFVGSEKYDEKEQEKLWSSLDRPYDGEQIGLGTLYHLAEPYGFVNPKKVHFTDVGNAKRLVARHGNNIRYVVEWTTWIVWKNNRWIVDNDYEIVRLAKDTINAMFAETTTMPEGETRTKLRAHAVASEDAKRVRAMVDMAKSELGVPISATLLDSNPYLLGVQNGAIDLKAFEFREARREDYITMYCNVHYNPRATCPNWLKFLNRIMDLKQDVISYLQRVCGYTLTGCVDEETMWIFWGEGKNGKSTYRETLNILLGNYAATFGVELLLPKKQAGGATPEVERLKGKRLATVNELTENDVLSEQRVKYIVSNEKISARGLYKDIIEFNPTHKAVVTTNHKPIIKGTDEGIWRRVHLVPFTVIIPQEERDPKFREKYLLPELPGILNWMLDGLESYYEQGLNAPEEVCAATEAYRNELDIIEQWLEECCERDPKAIEPIQALHDNYKIWAELEHNWAHNKRKFGRLLEGKGFMPDTGAKHVKVRRGLRLRHSTGFGA
jgi:putative DNA primase/helicase